MERERGCGRAGERELEREGGCGGRRFGLEGEWEREWDMMETAVKGVQGKNLCVVRQRQDRACGSAAVGELGAAGGEKQCNSREGGSCWA